MSTVQMQCVEKDTDIEKLRKMAIASSKRIQKERDKRLKQAIKEQDIHYLSRELSNVSSFKLFKILVHKFVQKYAHLY